MSLRNGTVVRVAAALVALVLFTSTPRPVAADESASARIAKMLVRARDEVRTKVVYDRRYVARGSGAPQSSRGACTDLVVRALAAGGIDVQTRLENDALATPAAYPSITSRDGRIDHRRATNLFVYFTRNSRKLPRDPRKDVATFRAGDVVVWTYGACPECKADHVGIVSDTIGTRGMPLVIHNAGPFATEEDAIDAWPILGHFRPLE